MYLDEVNTRIGTENEPRYSNGNIYPVTAVPFGMAHFTVQTDGGRGNWFYSPRSHSFEGFRLTHQPSPWVGDYGHLLFLPFSGELCKEGMRWSSYRPAEAVMRPDRMEVFLQRYRVRASLAPTERGCTFRLSREGDAPLGFAVFPFGAAEFRAEKNGFSGYTDAQSVWGFPRVREYFTLVSSAPCRVERSGDAIALYFEAREVELFFAASFVSEEQAKRNLASERREFCRAASEAAENWEKLLGTIEVEGERRDLFYSCLYRALLYPRVFHEYGENGAVHFNADTGRVEKGVFYTDNGFWDTYRTVYPLLSLIAPERYAEMAEGFLNYADETGWLPKWLSPGEIGLMPGALIEATLADAAVKGILKGEDLRRAYAAMLRNACETGEGRHGRAGAAEYRALGYVPQDFRESVNQTLDSAYGDWCVSVVAGLFKDEKRQKEFLLRSKNYEHLFDKESRFFRGKDREGKFRDPFDPFAWGGDNCEGSSWQNSFSVCFDLEGLARLHGGRENLIARLDELFAAPPVYRVGGYGQEIHEMSEMACADFGQCAISNQPSFHLPWLYAALGAREKTEFWVKKLAREAFSCDETGFPGDEDNGTMAAWYVFACLGFYPLLPGRAEYVTGAPLFETIRLRGKPIARFPQAFVSHDELVK